MTDTQKMSEKDLMEAYRFIIKLGSIAHKYGMSTIRLTNYLDRVVKDFSLNGYFIVSPDFILYFLWEENDIKQFYHYAKMPSQSLDMNKLSMLNDIVNSIKTAGFSLKQGIKDLERIDIQKSFYGNVLTGIGYALTGAGISVLLSSTWGW